MVKVIKISDLDLGNCNQVNEICLLINEKVTSDKVVLVISFEDSEHDFLGGVTIKEKDRLLAAKQVINSIVMSHKLSELNLKAVSLSLEEVGIITDDSNGDGKIIDLDGSVVKKILENYDVVIIPGGFGISVLGDVCNLGKKGADLTTVAMAVSLGVDTVSIYGDAFYTCNPRICKEAKVISEISYDNVFKFLDNGIEFVGKRALEMAIECEVDIVLKDNFETFITDTSTYFKGGICVLEGFSLIEVGIDNLFSEDFLKSEVEVKKVIAEVVNKSVVNGWIVPDSQLDILESKIEKFKVESGYVVVCLLKQEKQLWEITKEILDNYGIKYYFKDEEEYCVRFYIKNTYTKEVVNMLHDIWFEGE